LTFEVFDKRRASSAPSPFVSIQRRGPLSLNRAAHEALLEAMEEALSKVTPADAAGWFGHCGYQLEVQYL
jgi:hypothetical protein